MGSYDRLVKPRRRAVGGRPIPLDTVTNPDNIPSLLNETRELSDEEYEDFINELGFRAALAKLRAVACEGDTKALDIYLKHCAGWREARRLRKTDNAGDPGSAALAPERKRKASVPSVDASKDGTSGHDST